jgi:fused signal recognition particle receptor
MQIPVRYIGVGERIDDLQVFDPNAFVEAMFSDAASAEQPGQ